MDDFDKAFRRLKSQDHLQFDLPETPPPPKVDWLDKIIEPILAFLKAISPLLELLFWGFVIGGVGLLLYVFTKAVLDMQRSYKQKQNKERAQDSLYRPSTQQALILLKAVDSLAEQGRYAEAVHQLLFRSIQDIGTQKPNMIRRSYTSREISGLSSLAPETRQAFSLIASEVERSHFGGQMLDKQAFERCRKAYAQFAMPTRHEDPIQTRAALTA
ncbi:hypothetical protein DES40_1440 [Litorimonas taeanensis]|uniref:DUF4129 domain-containing protein n=1 Tax=Litorimonas taeanensis TaxID=568099 RepID=A0A420WM57_9PROT|nr:hypothetical protein [Litorimonas taeanensis]RKQ72103.1 hypothetical protein DES40_1440 [Litorimonas taeanensis]